jgi:hypothetical protein
MIEREGFTSIGFHQRLRVFFVGLGVLWIFASPYLIESAFQREDGVFTLIGLGLVGLYALYRAIAWLFLGPRKIKGEAKIIGKINYWKNPL